MEEHFHSFLQCTVIIFFLDIGMWRGKKLCNENFFALLSVLLCSNVRQNKVHWLRVGGCWCSVIFMKSLFQLYEWWNCSNIKFCVKRRIVVVPYWGLLSWEILPCRPEGKNMWLHHYENLKIDKYFWVTILRDIFLVEMQEMIFRVLLLNWTSFADVACFRECHVHYSWICGQKQV